MLEHPAEGVAVFFVIQFVWVLLCQPATGLIFIAAIVWSSVFGRWDGFWCAFLVGNFASLFASMLSYYLAYKFFADCLR